MEKGGKVKITYIVDWLVGVPRLELGTSRSQSAHSTN